MIKNLDQIDELKRRQVENGMLFIDEMNRVKPTVRKVILFGSSVAGNCKRNSDLDLCFITDFNCKDEIYFQIFSRFEDVTGSLCDIFRYDQLKGSLKDDVDSKGVVVYEY